MLKAIVATLFLRKKLHFMFKKTLDSLKKLEYKGKRTRSE